MILSLPKCNTLIISNKEKTLSPNVNIDGPLFHFDNVISWDEHINAIRNNITKTLYLLQRIKLLPTKNVRKIFVNSYFPHFDYCFVVSGNCYITLVKYLGKLCPINP